MGIQVNIRLPKDLVKKVETYVKKHGFKNIQHFAQEAMREKMMEEDSLKETMEIMKDKKLVASIKRSIEDVKRGRVLEFGSIRQLRKRYK